MDEAEKKLGAPLYCVVNNAGVMGEKEGWRLWGRMKEKEEGWW